MASVNPIIPAAAAATAAGLAGYYFGAHKSTAGNDEEVFYFSSESVTEGHPDKMCDNISDAILDACLKEDPQSKVACNSSCKGDFVVVYGEITTKAQVDFEATTRNVIKRIGYDDVAKGLDYKTCEVKIKIQQQSPDIAQGVHINKKIEQIGAGDQGMMFGYACDETPELFPVSHLLANKLCERLTEVRKNGTLPWLRPDGKSQLTVEYKKKGGVLTPVRIHTLVISAQHDDNIPNETIHAELIDKVIKPVIPSNLLDANTRYFLNPSGRFVIGGPSGDSGLTGRKIIVDTYGGWGAHGGGAFSGKDPTKVDRSAAYIARQAAKSLVAAGLAKRVLIQLSYAIGIPEPLAVFVDTYGTGVKSDDELSKIVQKNFDLRPGFIIRELGLTKPIYEKTASYGHFGREDQGFPWEQTKPLAA